MTVDSIAIEQAIFRLLDRAGPGHTVSATEVAREAGGDDDWERLFPLVRRAAVTLATAGRLVIYRKGKPVDPADFKGVYRLGLPSQQ